MAKQEGISGAGPDTAQAVRAEVDAVIETAGKAAHEGLPPDADGLRVLAGLILQLAEQVARLLDDAETITATTEPSPDEAEASTEEDMSPRDAPADPSRSV